MNNSVRFSNALQEHMNDPFVYGKFIVTEDWNSDSESFEISVSLTNKYMLKADAYFFAHTADDAAINELVEEYFPTDSYSTLEQSVFEGYHPYFFEFHGQSKDQHLRSRIRELAGQWLTFELTDRQNTDPDSLHGTLLLGASPIIHKGTSLRFNPGPTPDALMTYLDRVYSAASLARITRQCINNHATLKRFQALLPADISHIAGTVYNVGQGNNIKLHMKDNAANACTILFDIGCTYRNKDLRKADIRANLSSFAKEQFDAVVLSHWDTDHILAVEYYNEHLLYSKDMVWLAPDLNVLPWRNISHSAYILACYLRYKSRLYLSNNFDKKLNIANKSFAIWQGKNRPTGSNSHNNAIGLIIELKGNGYTTINGSIPAHHLTLRKKPVATLLTGDCPYDNLPEPLRTDRIYDILVSPHHGSKHTIPDLAGTKDSTAIISCGIARSAYPKAQHVRKLLANGFPHIYVTKWVSNVHFEIYF